MLNTFFDILEVCACSNLFGIITVAYDYDVDTAVVALGGFLQCEDFVLAIFVAVLGDMAGVGIVFALEAEYHVAFADFGGR